MKEGAILEGSTNHVIGAKTAEVPEDCAKHSPSSIFDPHDVSYVSRELDEKVSSISAFIQGTHRRQRNAWPGRLFTASTARRSTVRSRWAASLREMGCARLY